jgi:hypothetical protein
VARIGEVLLDPKDPQSIVDVLNRVIQVLDQGVELGDPLNPLDDSSVVLAGSGSPTVHNGRVANIRGSWVSVEFAAADTAVAFNHNLDIPVFGTNEPNVRWLFSNFRHSGVGPAVSNLNLEYDDLLCTMTKDSIDLVLRSQGVRTIAVGANAVKVDVFFVPAVRWP